MCRRFFKPGLVLLLCGITFLTCVIWPGQGYAACVASGTWTPAFSSSPAHTFAPSTEITITGFTPTSGPVGTVFSISGTGFQPDEGVSTVNVGNAVDNPEPVVDLQVCFNDVPAAFEVVSDTQILATVPSGATTGPIKVQRDDEEFAVSSVPFVVTTASAPPPPIISSFTPPSGPVGTIVTIFGSGFVQVSAVRFNGVAATFTVNSSTQITATVPAGATTGPITVITLNGTATSSTNFVVTTGSTPPIISSFTPPSGPVGTIVTIFGSGFVQVSAVRFNGVAATFTVNSSTQITATVPAGATTGPISVTGSGGTAISRKPFVVLETPTLTSFSPTSGPVGTVVTITGTGFVQVSAVRFNGVAATFTVSSPTQITATVPAGATTGPISVITPGGTATSSTPFVVLEAPTLTSFSPTSGPVGTVVTITGTGFVQVSAVRFNGVAATFTVSSPTQITATVPAGATTGPISVITPGGTATSSTPFVVLEAPTLTSFSPTSGPVGTSVTITGINFINVSSVTFGDLAARFTVTSPTQITAIVPVGAVTAPIRVVTPAGTATSATSFTVIPRVPPQTIGVWRPNQGFLLRQSNTAGPPDIAVPLGQPGDQPVVGDWDGDGKTTVALFRAGQFLMRNENAVGAPVTTVAFGQAGDIPVAGDWTGKALTVLGSSGAASSCCATPTPPVRPTSSSTTDCRPTCPWSATGTATGGRPLARFVRPRAFSSCATKTALATPT